MRSEKLASQVTGSSTKGAQDHQPKTCFGQAHFFIKNQEQQVGQEANQDQSHRKVDDEGMKMSCVKHGSRDLSFFP
jgi:hypothetical protein